MRKIIFVSLIILFYIFDSYSLENISEDETISETKNLTIKENTARNNNSDTLMIMMLRHFMGHTPSDTIDKTPLEIVNFDDKYKVRFNSTIKSGFYIKISTAYDEDEGLRRLKKFNEIFDSIIGYEEDGKYNIVMGPLEEKEINDKLSVIRKFGYIDAVIIRR